MGTPMNLADAATVALGWIADAQTDRKTDARSAVDDLLLALDLGLAYIEAAETLQEAQVRAGHLRDALKEGW